MQSNNTIVLACAGSGKTWGICNDALRNYANEKKILMVSYTHKGIHSLKREFCKQNLGILNKNIKIYTWFQFLLRELIKPYQRSFTNTIGKIRSCDFSKMYGPDYFKKRTIVKFLNKRNDVRANYASELAILLNSLSNGAVLNRLKEIYSFIYIDELQDLVGKDIDLLELLFLSPIRIYCVGDNKQATLRTHNPKSNKKKGGIHIFDYLEPIKDSHNLTIIKDNCSRRFVEDVAQFANILYPENPVTTNFKADKTFTGVFQILEDDIQDYIRFVKPTILRYNKRTNTLGFQALNFGASKGMTIDNVLIFPNKKMKKFLINPPLGLDKPQKYYVGVTRSKYSLTFVMKKLYKNAYFKEVQINLGFRKIKALKFISNQR